VPDASAQLPAVSDAPEPSAAIDGGTSAAGVGAPDPEPTDVVPAPSTDAGAPDSQPSSSPDASTEPSVVAELTWASPTPIEDYGGHVFAPKVATDAAGNAVAVWRQFDDSVPQRAAISANRFVGTEGFGEDVPVFEVTSTYINDPCIAGNPDGAVVAAWATSSSADASSVYAVWAVLYSPTSGWSDATQVGPSAGPATSVECAIDDAGNAALVWSQSDESTTGLYAAHFAAGGSWAPYEPIGASTNVGSISLSMNARGDALLAWNDWSTEVPTMWSLGYSTSVGWLEPLSVPASTERTSYYVDVALGPEGDAVLVWSEHSTDGLQHQIWASHQLSSTEWGSPEQLDDGLQINALPVVGIDALGNALAAWEGFSEATTQNDVRVNRYSPERGWEGPSLLAANATQVNLSMRPTGVAVATWRAPYDYTVDGDIAAASYSAATGWSEATTFSDDDAGNSTVPHGSVNDGGGATVVWLNQDSQGSDVWASRRE
jgi:hypothetical protein